MTVIAMTREMGARGKDVAIALAERLDISIVHPNIVETDLSNRLQVEQSDVHRYLEGETSLLQRWALSGKALIDCTAAGILELAEGGNLIIRGWGSMHLLRPVDHVLCVRVCAPLERRIDTMVGRTGMPRESARREIVINDRAHDRVLKRVVRADWRDPLLYDLVVNTDRLSVEEAAALIERTSRLPTFLKTSASVAALKRLRIEAQIRSRLAQNNVSRRDIAAVSVTFDPDTGHVVLSGGIHRQKTRGAALEIARGVPDVEQVEDRLMVVRE